MNKEIDEAPVVELRVMQYVKPLDNGKFEFSSYHLQWRTAGSRRWNVVPVIQNIVEEDGSIVRTTDDLDIVAG